MVLLASMKLAKLAKSDVMSKLKQEIKFSAHTGSRKCHRANDKFGRWPICSRSIGYIMSNTTYCEVNRIQLTVLDL